MTQNRATRAAENPSGYPRPSGHKTAPETRTKPGLFRGAQRGPHPSRVYDDAAAAERARRKAVERAVERFRARTKGLRQSYRRTLIGRIEAAAEPGREGARILAQLKATLAKTTAAPASCPDLSAATEARAAMVRKQPDALAGIPAFEAELRQAERGLLCGSISQADFNATCRRLAAKPLPSWVVEYRPAPPPQPAKPLERVPSHVFARLGPPRSAQCATRASHTLPELPAVLRRATPVRPSRESAP